MLKRFLVAVAFVFLANPCWADFNDNFSQAEGFYREANYDKAIELYESILNQAQETSANLHYNLANAYFKKGKLGKAVVHYEKAFQINPRDPDIKSNLNFAYSFVKGDQASFGKSVMHKMAPHIDSFSLNEIAYINLVLLFVLTIFIVWLAKQPVSLFRKISFSIVAICILIFHIYVYGLKVSQYSNVAIVLKKTEAKFEPIIDATTHYHLPEGSKVRVLKSKVGWYKIKRADDKEGWIKITDAQFINES